MPEYNYEEELKINSGKIEEALVDHANLFMKYAELHANAIKEKDRLKQRLELIYSELDAELRSNYQSYFARKPTENQIKNWISVHPKYTKAQGLYAESCHDVNITAGAKEAFSQRRYILGHIVSMKLTGIFADPKPTEVVKRLPSAPIKKALRLKRN